MYDTITPAQWVIGLVISLAAFGVLTWLLWRYFPRDGRPHNMSTSTDSPRSDSAGLDQSIDQSAPTSLDAQTTPVPATGLNAATPDMDAENWPMPPVSAYLTDQEFLVMLARQKTRAGSWRLSANAIVKVVGGDRTQVLKTIRDVREGPAELRPLSPEQQQLREQLQLERRGS